MSISIQAASIATFKRLFVNLEGILDKAAAYAETRKIEPEVLLKARLAPDMFPLVKQVQIASDNAKGAAARLAGVEPPKFADDEQSFDDLKARVRKTIAFLDTIQPAQLETAAARDITLKFPWKTYEFKGEQYLLAYALPNIYFHVSMAYAILRHNGLEVGKGDFLGAI